MKKLTIPKVLPLAVAAAMGGQATADNSTGFSLEEITVTARKVKEDLQTTPIAVTAMAGDALTERDMTSISAIGDVAPNVNFSFGGTSSGSGSAAVIFIRGVGQNDFTAVTDPGVGLYVDGVYLGRSVGSVLDLLNLESVEVLRGPQGTLFGRNTIGGAINLNSIKPGHETSGNARVTIGDDGRREVFAAVDLPLSDNLSSSFSALSKIRDGYVDRVISGEEMGDVDSIGARAAFYWTPSDEFALTLAIDGTKENTESAAEVALDLSSETVTGLHAGTNARVGPINETLYPIAPYESYETGPSMNIIDSWGASVTAEWDIGDNVTAKSITAYRKLDAAFSRSSDGSPHQGFETLNDFRQNQFSQEFQFVGRSFDDRLGWVAGLYYFEEEAKDFGIAQTDPAVVPIWPLEFGGVVENANVAVYGEATFDITEQFHLTGGIRYTDEDKDFSAFSHWSVPFAGFEAFEDFIPTEKQELSFEEVTYRVTAAYDISNDTMAYATVSTGFKSGGFHIRNTSPSPTIPSFEPEFVDLYEIGLKTEFSEIGLRLNLAAFLSEYTDMQVSANPPGEIATFTANAADAEIKGVEVEFTYIPADNLFIQGSYGYQHAEYTRINQSSNVEVTKDDRFIRTPTVTGNLSMSYIIDLNEDLSLTPHVDWVHKSKTHFEPVNNHFAAQESHDIVNMHVSIRDTEETWSLTFGLKNAFDKKYLLAADSNGGLGYALGVYAQPRNWYLSYETSF